MELPLAPARRALRLGLRQQLVLGSALLSLLFLGVLAVQLLSLASIARSAREAIAVDGELSRLAGQIGVATLECRRFEKDMLINIDDPATRADYFARWQAAYAELGAAIDRFAGAAVTGRDRQQASAWREGWQLYGEAVRGLDRSVAQGAVTTTQAGNAALEPFKTSIRLLTDTSIAMAAEKAQIAAETGGALQSTIAQTTVVSAVLGGAALAVAVACALWFPPQLMRPVAALQVAARRMAAGDLTARTGVDRADELGDLARGFDAMAAQIAARTAELAQQYADAEAARKAAELARAEVAQQLVTIEEQRDVIHSLSVPILPINERALVMPLVGALDSARLQLAQERALDALAGSQVKSLILDITGVPVIDTQVARGLLQLAQGARLLGSSVTVVGVQPEVAQTLVQLGIAFGDLRFQTTLRDAVGSAARSG